MKLNMPWATDPKNNKKSVSLTLVILSTVLYMGAIAGNIAGAEVDTSLITQFWFGSCGLYFGRRISFSKDGNIETERNKEDAR